MPRQARIVIPRTAHHITQRGNYRQNVFDKQRDDKQYCEWINEYAQETGLDILAYCLMKNHVHFVVVPKQESDLAAVFKTAHMRYVHYNNRQRKAKGHLWQGRFYSCILQDTHLYRVIRYVENNPLWAKIVKYAWNYEYSSAKDHTKERDKPLIIREGKGVCSLFNIGLKLSSLRSENFKPKGLGRDNQTFEWSEL